MRPLVFVFPNARLDIGGNSAQVRFMETCARFTDVRIAYSGERIAGADHLDDLLGNAHSDQPIYVIHWGPDVAELAGRLADRDVVYFAHSTGWGMTLPPRIPILCVSRNTLGYWGRHAPNAYLAYVPNIVDFPVVHDEVERDVDVLVQMRKSSPYLLDELVPALRERCRVTVLDGWVDDLAAWFRRSKVYLYDSLEHWIDVGATEGFGLPPLEALSQGCVVFSSLNDALADYLDPGMNCRKIRVHSLDYDVGAVLEAITERAPAPANGGLFAPYTYAAVAQRLELVFADLERFFARTRGQESNIEDPWESRKPNALQRAKKAIRVLAG